MRWVRHRRSLTPSLSLFSLPPSLSLSSSSLSLSLPAERKPPLFHMNAMSALYHIAQIDPPRLAHPGDWSSGFHKLVTRCLKKAPEDRPTGQELLQDVFLSSCGGQSVDVLFQLVQRTKEAVQLLDNQNFRRLQKMLMSAEEEGEEAGGENDEIESEPPRSVGGAVLVM